MAELSTVLEQKASAKPDTAHAQYMSDDEKIAIVLSVADLMTKGERSTSALSEHLAKLMPQGTVSRPTVIKYRNAALAVIERESKPMNRENIRQLEVGRYTYMIEHLYKKICSYEATKPKDGDVYRWHDTYAKLWARLNDLGARLHSITGLNEITINNGDERKRITFIRPSASKTIDNKDIDKDSTATTVQA